MEGEDQEDQIAALQESRSLLDAIIIINDGKEGAAAADS